MKVGSQAQVAGGDEQVAGWHVGCLTLGCEVALCGVAGAGSCPPSLL